MLIVTFKAVTGREYDMLVYKEFAERTIEEMKYLGFDMTHARTITKIEED